MLKELSLSDVMLESAQHAGRSVEEQNPSNKVLQSGPHSKPPDRVAKDQTKQKECGKKMLLTCQVAPAVESTEKEDIEVPRTRMVGAKRKAK
jgi:hypothetical protein